MVIANVVEELTDLDTTLFSRWGRCGDIMARNLDRCWIRSDSRGVGNVFLSAKDASQRARGSGVSGGVAAASAAAVVDFRRLVVVNFSDQDTGFFSSSEGRGGGITALLAQRQATHVVRIGAYGVWRSGDFRDGKSRGMGGFVEVATDHTCRQATHAEGFAFGGGMGVGGGGDLSGFAGGSHGVSVLDDGDDTVDCGLDES